MQMRVWMGTLVVALLISGCMVVDKVRLESDPPGAAVYLVPKWVFERDPSMLTDQDKMRQYRVPEGDTPVDTRAREMVYVVVFVRDGNVVTREMDVLPGKANLAKAVFP